ncbi:TetR/AcrR family transcriptional regulator [Ferrovibrio sp. MS7]|uniref:TetR/AcrR family transcriptional regulator n=1 Tax=Ferrovibrio plantarum TaxID=3119164 RepID=UPI003135613A
MRLVSTNSEKPGKRQRTRAQLVQAARIVFSVKGLQGASIQEIAAEAGLANGTFYNYFQTKEEIAQAVAVESAVALSQRIAQAHAGVEDGAERVAIGARHYMRLAVHEPVLAGLIVHLAAETSDFAANVRGYVQADFQLGQRQGRFAQIPAPLALDFIFTTVLMGMRRLLQQQTRNSLAYASSVVTLVLSGLGMPQAEAAKIARRPLPPLPEN